MKDPEILEINVCEIFEVNPPKRIIFVSVPHDKNITSITYEGVEIWSPSFARGPCIFDMDKKTLISHAFTG